jgi:hypothetical protein
MASNVILLNVILMNALLLNALLFQNAILMTVICGEVILLTVILQNAFLLNIMAPYYNRIHDINNNRKGRERLVNGKAMYGRPPH